MASNKAFNVKKGRSGILFSDKVKIIKDLENGLSVRDVMYKYRIKARSTIYNIQRNKLKIMDNIANIQGNFGKKLIFQFEENTRLSLFTAHRKHFKQARHPKVDEALYIWFLQQRQRHIPVSQDMLQVQSEKFFNELVGEGNFGSRGYIDKFIKRHDIRLLKITGEKLSSNLAVIDEYVQKFAVEMNFKDLQPCQIFNADESGLYFKSTPTNSYVDKDSVDAPGKKVMKERLTFMPCSNMDGSLKLPLMVIGKYLHPRPLKNLKVLPVHYAASKNAWMTRNLFKAWFFEQFVPQVQKFLEDSGLPIRAVLVLDNCSAHYSSEELKTDDGAIWTKFLPPNTTAVIQPMDQNVIQMIKSRYRQIMMREVLGRPGDFHDNVKKINVKDAIFWVAQSWDLVPQTSIRKSWNLLYNPEVEDEDDLPLSVIKNRLSQISEKIRTSDTIDEENAEFEFMKDEEIVEKVLNPSADDEMSYNTMDSSVPGDDTLNDSELVDDDYQPVQDEYALNAIDVMVKYAEDNSWPLNSQFSLREMRTKIFEKIADRNSS